MHKQAQKGGVCKKHKEFAIDKKVDYVIYIPQHEKANYMICSVEGCTGKAANTGDTIIAVKMVVQAKLTREEFVLDMGPY